jgi:hypothetical protein
LPSGAAYCANPNEPSAASTNRPKKTPAKKT